MWLIPVSVGISTLALCLVIYAVRKELIDKINALESDLNGLKPLIHSSYNNLQNTGLVGRQVINGRQSWFEAPQYNVGQIDTKLNLLLNHLGLKYKVISIDKPELVKQDSDVFELEYVDYGDSNDTLIIKKQKCGKNGKI